MRNGTMRAGLCALLTVTGLAVSGHADTIKVPDDVATLSEALLDPDLTGDDVIVITGRIDDNAIVPGGLAGLTIQGQGKKGIIDSHLGAGDGSAAAAITAPDEIAIRPRSHPKRSRRCRRSRAAARDGRGLTMRT